MGLEGNLRKHCLALIMYSGGGAGARAARQRGVLACEGGGPLKRLVTPGQGCDLDGGGHVYEISLSYGQKFIVKVL